VQLVPQGHETARLKGQEGGLTFCKNLVECFFEQSV
jgi:hypothetical protein